MDNEFAKNLKKNMKSKSMTAQIIADKIGVTRGAVTNWSNGVRTPNPEQIEQLAKALNIKVSDLFGENTLTSIRTVPLIGLASCGVPQNYDLNGYEPVPVSADIYKDGMYAVRADGDSMSPKINNNNLVYCVADQQIENGDIVHYSFGDESAIKKYKLNDRGDIISLVPLNSDYDIITIHADDNLSIKMAKVVGVVDTDF